MHVTLPSEEFLELENVPLNHQVKSLLQFRSHIYVYRWYTTEDWKPMTCRKLVAWVAGNSDQRHHSYHVP